MSLRDYQRQALDRVRQRMQGGARRVVLCVPTGGGKTVIGTEAARRTVAAGRRVLWLAHRAELVDQAAETLTAAGLLVGTACASSSMPPNPYAPVQVGSVQTLLARNLRPGAELVVADECHHFADAAESFAAFLRSYDRAHVLGLTATPERGDGCGLGDPWDALVVGSTVRELTEGGHLVPCEVLRPDRALEPGKIAQSPVDAYVEHATGRRAIVFVRSVALAEEYAAEYRMRGIQARAISAETPWGERKLVLGTFKRGGIQVLVNVYVLTEGFDDPGVSCCILARGCGSAGMYLQMIGRVLRPAPGKRDALLLDLRGVSHEHGRPEDPREYSLEGRGIRLSDPNSYCPVCGAPRTPPDPCESCGYAPSGEDGAKPDKITGDKLVPYAYKRQENDDQRAKTLAKWLGIARARGYKPGWVYAKYSAVYASRPSQQIVSAAEELLARREEAVAV